MAAAREVAPEQRAVVVEAIPAAPQIGGILTRFRREHPDIPVRWEPLDLTRPTVDIPPFVTRMLWRTGESDTATLAFVRHVLAEHGDAAGGRAGV